jgi:hypothetical protein
MHNAQGEPLFSKEQIVSIASHNGARQVLEFLCDEDKLRKLRTTFDPEQIVSIASHGGSTSTLAAVLDSPWSEHLTREELVRLVSVHSGSMSLSWFLQYWPALRAKGVSKQQAISAGRRGKGQKATFLKKHGVPVAPSKPKGAATPVADAARTGSALALRLGHANAVQDGSSTADDADNEREENTWNSLFALADAFRVIGSDAADAEAPGIRDGLMVDDSDSESVAEPLPFIGSAAEERADRDAMLQEDFRANEGELGAVLNQESTLDELLFGSESEFESEWESESAPDPYPIAGDAADPTRVAQDLDEVAALLAWS